MRTLVGIVMMGVVAATATAADQFPTGQTSPEGVACDLARAFIKRDAALFQRIVVPPLATQKPYAAFLKQAKSSICQEAKKKVPSPGGPKKIVQCYAARRLSMSGPASYGYAAFGYKDVKFVDVAVELHNGKAFMNRTLVVQDKNGKWLVHPAPTLVPLLSAGLNEESASSKVWKPKGR